MCVIRGHVYVDLDVYVCVYVCIHIHTSMFIHLYIKKLLYLHTPIYMLYFETYSRFTYPSHMVSDTGNYNTHRYRKL